MYLLCKILLLAAVAGIKHVFHDILLKGIECFSYVNAKTINLKLAVLYNPVTGAG